MPLLRYYINYSFKINTMKRLALSLVLVFCLISTINAQEKTRGFFITGGIGMGFIHNVGNLNTSLGQFDPQYKDLGSIEANYKFGVGVYFFDKLSIKYELEVSDMFVVREDHQYTKLNSGGIVLSAGYVIIRHLGNDLELNAGVKFEGSSLLHTREVAGVVNSLSIQSGNIMMPVGITWWIYPSGQASMANRAIGINLSYDILLSKEGVRYAGLKTNAPYPSFHSNSLKFGLYFRI